MTIFVQKCFHFTLSVGILTISPKKAGRRDTALRKTGLALRGRARHLVDAQSDFVLFFFYVIPAVSQSGTRNSFLQPFLPKHLRAGLGSIEAGIVAKIEFGIPDQRSPDVRIGLCAAMSFENYSRRSKSARYSSGYKPLQNRWKSLCSSDPFTMYSALIIQTCLKNSKSLCYRNWKFLKVTKFQKL